jgi:hypothetical protein
LCGLPSFGKAFSEATRIASLLFLFFLRNGSKKTISPAAAGTIPTKAPMMMAEARLTNPRRGNSSETSVEVDSLIISEMKTGILQKGKTNKSITAKDTRIGRKIQLNSG